MRFRPSGLSTMELSLFYIFFGGVVVSGLVWLYLDSFVRIVNELGTAHHPLQSAALAFHGLLAAIFLFVLGWMFNVHWRHVWPLRKKRKSGLFLTGLTALMCSSGYGLYYLSQEDVRRWTAFLHWTIGLAFVLMLTVHVFIPAERSSPRRKK